MNPSFWPVIQAKKIIARLPENKDTVIFETGYGPSGLPHIGTFAEVARANFVIMALKELRPELKTRLIAFSDDRDGLRKLAPNIPNHELLLPHMGKPLTKVPDPFGQKDSFAEYMNSKLREFLNTFRFEYEYFSATEAYESGLMDEVLLKVADHYQEIREVFIKTIHPDKRADWSPFLPICENCGRLYSTKVLLVDQKNYFIEYSCQQSSKSFTACSHKGRIAITGKNIKLGWKVDWAARWYALDVDYELHGEDLLDSVRVSRQICKILGKPGPLTYKYELFVDEEGQKISKTKGNGVSMEQWLRYSPLNGLLYFTLSEPNRIKRMGLPIMPRLIDEYLTAEKKALPLDINNPLWYVARFNSYDADKIRQYLSYQLLVNIAESLSSGAIDVNLLVDYSNRYQPGLSKDDSFIEFCQKVAVFVQDNTAAISAINLNPDEKYIDNLKKWQSYLDSLSQELIVGEEAQKKIFSLAKESKMPIKEWFKFLYNVYLNKNEGPKLGQYFAVLGKAKSLELTAKALNRFSI